MAVVSKVMRGETKRVLQAEQTKTLLLEEMAHRTINNLAILSAMVRLEARNGDPAVPNGKRFIKTSRRIL